MSYSCQPSLAAVVPEKSSGKSLAGNILGTFASSISVFVLSMISSVIINRALGPEGKGVYAVVLTVSQLIALVASLGLAKSITYHLAQPELDRKKYFGNAVMLALLAAMLSGLFIYLTGHWGPATSWQKVFRDSYWMVALLTTTAVFTGYGLGTLRGLRSFKSMNLCNPLTTFIFVVLLVLAIGFGGLSVNGVILAKLSASAIVLVFIVSCLRKQDLSFIPRIDKVAMSGLLSYGFGYFGYVVFQNLNYRIDVLLVSNLLDATHAGWYATATGLAEILWFIPNSIGIVLMPVVVSTKGSAGDQLTAKVCRVSVALMAVGALGLVIGGHLVVKTLYGTNFVPAVSAIYALAFGILTNGLYTVLGAYLASRNLLRKLMGITVCGFVANLLLNLWWIPTWGIVGAGLASTVSYTVTGLLVAFTFVKTTNIGWRECLFIKPDELRYLLDYALKKFRKFHS